MRIGANSRSRRIAVLGGGMAGCVLSAELARNPNVQVDLYERSDRLGGLHHSRIFGGLPYDVGAFFFDCDHQVFASFPGLIDKFVPSKVTQVSIGPGGKLDIYPLSIRGYVRNHGLIHFARAAFSIVWSKLEHRACRDLPSFIKYHIGSAVYHRSGLKAYIERLYSMPDDHIDLIFAQQRMADLRTRASFRAIAHRLLRPSPLGTLHASHALARPSGGFGEAYDYIGSCLRAQGVAVRLGAAINRINREAQGFTVRIGNVAIVYDEIVSTVPVPVTGRLIDVPVNHRFETISLLTLFYRFCGETSHSGTVAYNFCDDGRWKRITDFSRLYGKDGDANYFAVEVPLRPGPIDVETERLAFEQHVAGLDIFRGHLAFQGSHVTPSAYPVYRARSVEDITVDAARLAAWGIRMCGRQGRFEYATSKQVAASAAALAADMQREWLSFEPMTADDVGEANFAFPT